MGPNSKPLAILPCLRNTTASRQRGAVRLHGTGSAAQFVGGGGAAPMDQGDDEYLVTAQLVDDAPGVHGDFADVGVVEFRDTPADAGRGG